MAELETYNPPGRSDSLTSSIASSGSGLARRPRIRGRTRTLTEDSGRFDGSGVGHNNNYPPIGVSKEQLRQLVAEPIQLTPPPRPPRSPQRASTVGAEIGAVGVPSTAQRERKASATSTRSVLANRSASASLQDLIDLKNAIAGKRGASLPRIHPPHVAHQHPPLPTIDTTSSAHEKNDSVQTQLTSSASLYPNSPHTVSPSESSSLSPHSLVYPAFQDNGIIAVDPDPDSPVLDGYGGDDVSYRLRLLVKNSYFLPPAHSKPLASDLTSPLKPQKPSSRAATPTFLDLFRLGKSRSRPSTASSTTTAVESMSPFLRTTSDNTSVGGYIPRSQARTSPRRPTILPHNGVDPSGRVVVIREVMDDLSAAAKEAEQDMKVREWRNSQMLMDGFPDVIDPTDAVDLPPPSAGYPFAVQSTTTHGLGVGQSVGAADLADRLPPPNSPGGSFLDAHDSVWRKALLHEAVGLSLNGSPTESMFSRQIHGASPISVCHPNTLVPMSSPVGISGQSMLKRALDQRIISQPVIEYNEDQSADVSNTAPETPLPHSKSRHFRGLSTPDSHIRQLSYVPRRAETPANFHTPLAPPPLRSAPTRSLRSAARSEFATGPAQGNFALSPPPVRKVHSSPALADNYESGSSTSPRHPPSMSSSVPMQAGGTHIHDSVSTTSSYYTDEMRDGDVEAASRPSLALSVPTTTDDRHSISDRGQPSPAVSAFQDARYDRYQPSPTADNRLEHSARVSQESAAPRYSTMSPPPRASTSLSNAPLFPPPRSSSLHYKLVTTRASTSLSPSPTSSRFSNTSVIHTPPSNSIPLSPPSTPIASRRGNAVPAPLMLSVDSAHVPVSIHSAPPPASPTSFFDNIHDGMQDLESSESGEEGVGTGESDSENDADVDTTAVHAPSRPRAMSNNHQPPSSKSPRSRTSFSFSRFGNRSTPDVTRQGFSPTRATFSPTLSRFKVNQKSAMSHKPISNVPPRPSFFAKAGKSPKKSPLEYAHIMQPPKLNDDPLPPPPLPIISNEFRGSPTSIRGQKKSHSGTRDESLRKLDGLMLQHMKAEKDRIKQIARTIHRSDS